MLTVNKVINSHRSIIFLNGFLPDKRIINHINTSSTLIAADGAVNEMKKLDLIPDLIIGDEDSVIHQNKNIKTIKILDQNYTDFEKCIFYVKEQNLLPALVLGINGGEIDHVLGNIQVILKHANNQELYFLDTYEKKSNSEISIGIKMGIVLSNNKLSIDLKHQSTISIISFDAATINSKNLNWELENKKLNIDGVLALRNKNTKNSIELEIVEGKALVIFDISEVFFG
ncbi:MAG: thiamine diphosphokinase [Parachlamydiales bacterium]|nr:thiamine diphosphokinase [Parachlamydiales bacterium]